VPGRGRRYTSDVPFLSPAKLLVVLLVAVVVLGPDKLPKVARQVGSLWGDCRRLRQRLESDVRGNFPDLPSTDKITQAVRSPISFLDSLADTHADDNEAARPAADESPPTDPVGDGVVASGSGNRPNGSVHADEEASIPGVSISDPQGTVHALRAGGPVVPDDPSMN
jgi:sec-independent protein translocase protein TatB